MTQPVTGRLPRLIAAWRSYWFEDIPPYSAAMLRMAFGAMVLLGLMGLTPVDTYWALDGLSPLASNSSGPKLWLMNHGLAVIAGRVFFACSTAAAVAMLVGFWSDAAVVFSLLGAWMQLHWNRLPLSSAHQVVIVVLFSLAWMDTGKVWSVDAVRRRTTSVPSGGPIWPIRLIRCQIALIYLSSALWKILYPTWRDGSASHWAMSLNGFHRFPWPLPPAVDAVVPLFTWSTLAFELMFPVLVWFRITRVPVLLAGVGLHLGLFFTLEIGPFSWVMLASYLAFLDPRNVAALARRASAGERPRKTV